MAWLRKNYLILLLAIAAGIPQIIIYNAFPVIFLNDSVWYLDLTRYFATGGYFPDYYAFSKPVQSMIIYPLGYPLFLDLCKFLGTTLAWGRSVVLCQHVLSLCSVLLVFLIGIRISRRVEGFLAALAYALYLPRMIYAQSIMAETLCIFLSLLSIYIFFDILFEQVGKYKGLLLGIVAALAVLTKPLAILGAGVFFVYLLISRIRKGDILKFILSFAVIISANFIYNGYFFGQCVLTTSSGIHLANRVFGYDRLIDEKNPETRKIISQCVKSGLVFRFPGEWWDYFRALRSNGLSAQDADHLLMKAAMAGIRSNPSLYIKNTFLVFKKNILEEDHWIDHRWVLTKEDYSQYLHDWSTYPGGILPSAEYASRQKMLRTIAVDFPKGSSHALGVQWMVFFDNNILIWRGFLGWVFLFSCFYGLFAGDKHLFFFSVFTIISFLFIALTESPYPRYFETFVPIVFLLILLAFSTFLKKIPFKLDHKAGH